MKIAHIINPVKVGKDRDLHFQQPITFKTMEIARDFAKKRGLDVELHVTHYPEDKKVVPKRKCWQSAGLLDKSTEDLGYEPKRKLPYFKEILDNLYGNSDADYFIQTNADIGLQPFFYVLVENMIRDGNDSFVINKRVLPEVDIFKEVENIPIMWAAWGQPHNGHDCFVFRRELYPKFKIGDIVMGTPWSEATLIFNMIAKSKNFAEFKNAHATFHIGDRRIWLPESYNDYRVHNTNVVCNVLRQLWKTNKKKLDHPTIKMYLGKIKVEVKGYNDSRYNKNCHYFANGGK